MLLEFYIKLLTEVSDIQEHLETLRKLAIGQRRIVEIGTGRSTYALMMACPNHLTTIDIKDVPIFVSPSKYTIFKKIQSDSILVDLSNLESINLLFIDGYHSYIQVKKELEHYGPWVTNYIAFHDTVTFGLIDQDGAQPGILRAINEYLEDNPDWEIKDIYTNNNGLIILQKG